MKRLVIGVLVLTLSTAAFAAVRAPRPFQPNERVVFFGDSITTHNYFTYQLEFVDTLRNPEAAMETISRGHAGDTARGAVSRWDWDAATVPADRVFVMFGMNDVGRPDWKDENPSPPIAERRQKSLADYAEQMRRLTDKILGSGRRPVLMTPTPFDQYGRQAAENIPFCNDPGLAGCAEAVRRLADEKNLEMVEFHRPMTQILKDHPEFGLLAKDRIHPDGKGGLLMAALVLDQMGVLPYEDKTDFDAKGKRSASFAYAPRHLPYPRTPDYLAVNGACRLDGRLTREIVRIVNLPEGTYELSGDSGAPFGRFTSAELAKGVDLALCETPSMAQAKSAYAVYARRRRTVQRNRRLVSTEVILRNDGVDPEDETAVAAAIARRRAEIDRRHPDKKGRYSYFMGQLDFWEKNRASREKMWAESDALLKELRVRAKPAPWTLKVRFFE